MTTTVQNNVPRRPKVAPIFTMSQKEFDAIPPGPLRKRMLKKFGKSLRQMGFAALVDHMVDRALVDLAYDAAVRVFDLPPDVLTKYRRGKDAQIGYVSPSAKVLVLGAQPDLKEFWMIRQQGAPLENVWPEEVPEFREYFEQLFEEYNTVARWCCSLIEAYLELQPGAITQFMKGDLSSIRVIHYPPCEAGTVRGKIHIDINALTILEEERIRVRIRARFSRRWKLKKRKFTGLQLKRQDKGVWQRVRQPVGSFIVNLGESLGVWLEGNHPEHVMSPTEHGVFAYTNESDRYMIVFFDHFDLDTVLYRKNGVPTTMRDAFPYLLERIGYKASSATVAASPAQAP